MGSLRCTLCCGETFASREELRSHIKRVLENIFCSRCCAKFHSLENLLEHYNLSDCQVEKPFVSESVIPTSEYNKELHENELHDNKLQYKEVHEKQFNDKELQDKEIHEKEFNDMERQNKEILEKDFHDKHPIEKESQDKLLHEKELHDKELQEKELHHELRDGESNLKKPNDKELLEDTDEDELSDSVDEEERLIEEEIFIDENMDYTCSSDSISNFPSKNEEDISHKNENVKDSEKSEKDVEEQDMFQCSCGMMFKSIMEHLMKYHCDEEVIVKGNSDQLETLLNPVALEDLINKEEADMVAQEVTIQDAECIPSSTVSEEPEVIVCDRDKPMEENKKTITPLHKVPIDQLDGKVEECVDKDGRLYLRKFVRVEKFWSEKDEINAAKMLSSAKKFENVRDVPVGSVSVKSKDEAISDKVNGAPKKLFQCSKCKKTFQTMIHFRYHVCSVKTGPSTTCNLCGHESTSAKDLRAHWRMHQRQRRVAATALWELQASEGISNNCSVQEGDSAELQCERCGKMYKKCNELIHIAMHDEEPPYRCKKCSESFDAKDKLSRHMRSHREQKTHVCLYCGKTFTDSNAFKLHVRSHTGEKPFECNYCGKTFSRPYERMKHERIHTGERPHICEICGKTFRVSYCLTLHKRTHSGDRPYCCDICGKRFKAHSAYKHHVQIHSEERNYKCPYCPKAFKTMVHLAGHKKTHTKPFSCTECNRRFASLYSVKAHMESHKTGDNRFRYRCFVCGASYARAFALQYHMQTHGPCDAPEDVAEVLEICEEQDMKKQDCLSDLEEEEYIEHKEVDDLECDSLKVTNSVNS